VIEAATTTGRRWNMEAPAYEAPQALVEGELSEVVEGFRGSFIDD
jgi:hypothetical protein